MPRPPRYALRVREVIPGFVDCTSVYRQRTRRDPSRRPCGRFRYDLAAANGDPKITSRSRATARGACFSLLRRAGARCFWLLRVPMALRRQRTKRPRRG